MRVRVVLAVALLLVAGALALDMSGSAPRTAGSDHTSPAVFSATVPGGGVLCQSVAPLPGDAARAQVLIGTYGRPVPAMHLRFLDAKGVVVAEGRLPAGAKEGEVTIPLTHARGAPASTSACLGIGGSTTVVLGGEAGPVAANSELVNGKQQPGRISLIYIGRGDQSWWQLLPTLVVRFGLGKAVFFGDWTLPFVAVLLAGVWICVVWLLGWELNTTKPSAPSGEADERGPGHDGGHGHPANAPGARARGSAWISRATQTVRRAVMRVPRAGRVCFVIALINTAIWGVVVPPFQVPDEISHFAYAQYLAETGKPPPQGPLAQYSPEEELTLEYLDFFSVIGRPQMRGILTRSEDHDLRAGLATHPSPLGQGGSSSATSQPPLYYALETVPYWLSPWHEILARLAFMRLLSALIAACTVFAVFMFLRELLPRSPWAWTVGALVVAFQPMFNFIAAGVHGDGLLFLAAALTFLVLSHAYRRGLTTTRAGAIGACVAVGVLSKLTFIALLPGIALALCLLAWRALPAGRGAALRALLTAIGVAFVPVALYALLNVVAWHRGGITAGGVAGATSSALPGGGAVTLHETLDYTWELYLPPLWFMQHVYFAQYPLWHTWLNGAIGHFGWLDYVFPPWVYTDGRYILFGLLALALIGLVRVRRSIPPLLPLFICFGVMALGLLGAIGYAGIRYSLSTGYPFAQARYLFPLLPLYALFVVLAARGAGRRWAPALGAALVLLAMAHGLFAETLTISRYYG